MRGGNKMRNPYEKCPIYDTAHFLIRLIRQEDAEDLVMCYADSKSQELFNADNCTGDFCIYTADEMTMCIDAWLQAYVQEEYIRFAIADKSSGKAVGTIEMFGGDAGILRLDIASAYEEASFLEEIVDVCVKDFYDLFVVSSIATKAIPKAESRIKVLLEAGFHLAGFDDREHYYLRSK
jgi:RimJ/RimL family protein N-acetyltransferase